MEIRKLEREQWKDYELKFSYSTDGYYSFEVDNWDFQLVFHPYQTVLHKAFTDRLFAQWWESPMVFGAFEGDDLMGVVECSPESWNHRFRITNLLVFEKFRRQGVGKQLIHKAVEAGMNNHARMIVLEIQTCNRNAIEFYSRMGFQPIGFDLFCYSNHDPDKTEVRLEMAMPLHDKE